jgi:hypothetical protein
MIRTRTIAIREELGELPYLLAWQIQARAQIRYFSTYLAATSMLEALNERGIMARLYAELTIEVYKPERVEEPLPSGISREAYELSKEGHCNASRRLHRRTA